MALKTMSVPALMKLRGQVDAEMATRRKELEKKLSNF
jgi:hypothetical protein